MKRALGKAWSSWWVLCVVLLLLPRDAYAEEKANLYLDLKSDANLFLSTYDMDIYLDDTMLGTVANGQHFTNLVETTVGSHELKIYHAGNYGVYASRKVQVDADMTLSCDIAHGSTIEMKNIQAVAGVAGASLEVPDVTTLVLSDAYKILEETGFINIREEPYSEIWDKNNWTVTSQGIAAGTVTDKNTQIVLNCRKTDGILAEAFQGLTIAEAWAKSEEMGYTVRMKSDTSGRDLTEESRSFADEEKRNWQVASASAVYGKGKSCELRLLYTGEAEMPDVVGMKLYDAEKQLSRLEFSNVLHGANDDTTIWNTNNWEVIAQNIAAGTKVTATEKVILTARKYSESGKSSGSAAAPKTEGSGKEEEVIAVAPAGEKDAAADAAKQEEKPKEIQVSFEKPKAFRAAVAAVTNAFASDTKDGSGAYDASRFHTYNDQSGTLADYYLHISNQGTWTGKAEDTWHGENLCLEQVKDGSRMVLALDVTFDGTNYIVRNITDTSGTGRTFDETALCYTVTPDLIEKGRDFARGIQLLSESGYVSESILEENFPKEKAKDVIVVALTNNAAEDVFADDGNSYDPAKFHNIEYTGSYVQTITGEGSWSAVDNSTWHVENMYLLIEEFQHATKLNCNVSWNGEVYTVFNMDYLTAAPEYIDSDDPSKVSGWMHVEPDPENYPYLTVTPDLVKRTDPDELAAKPVIEAIGALPAVTAESGKDLQALRKQYDGLSKNAKKYVSNYDALVQAETQYKSLMYAPVDALVQPLKGRDITLADEETLSEAGKQLDLLDADLRKAYPDREFIEDGKKQIAQLKEEEKKRLEEEKYNKALAGLQKQTDDVTETTYYMCSTKPQYLNSRCYILPYFATKDARKQLMLTINYYGGDLLGWDEIYVKVDDEPYISRDYGIFSVDSDFDWNGAAWVENYNNDATKKDREILEKIANSTKCTIRFNGTDKYYDYTVPDSDKAAIRDLLYVYDNYKY